MSEVKVFDAADIDKMASDADDAGFTLDIFFVTEANYLFEKNQREKIQSDFDALKSQNERLIKQLEKFMLFTGDVKLEKNMEVYSLHEQTRRLISDLGIKGGAEVKP